MKLKIDHDADALYLTLDDSDVVESEEVLPGIIVDYNTDNKVVGIEMLTCRSARPARHGIAPVRNRSRVGFAINIY